MTIVCKNCATHFHGNFCSNCGQKSTAGRLKVSHVLEEFWHNFTHTDKGYLSLLRNMIQSPGIVIREYIEAKRKKHFNPYTFYLVTTALLIFVTGLVYKLEDKLYNYRNEYGQYINTRYNIIVLCCLPALAFLLGLIFHKKKYNYAEWVTFLVFTYGFINFFQVVIQLLYFPLIRYHASLRGYTELMGYFILLYVLVKFICPGSWGQWLQCIFATFIIYFVVEMLAAMVALGLWGVPLDKLLYMLKHPF